MEKIPFINYGEPGISAGILEKLQDNIEKAIDGEGWNSLELTDSFVPYKENNSNKPIYKKAGNIVSVFGAVSPAAEIKGSITKVVICTLPTGFRPVKQIVKLCQGTGKNFWTCTVGTNGEISFSRYGTTELKTADTSTWLPFDVSFFVS